MATKTSYVVVSLSQTVDKLANSMGEFTSAFIGYNPVCGTREEAEALQKTMTDDEAGRSKVFTITVTDDAE